MLQQQQQQQKGKTKKSGPLKTIENQPQPSANNSQNVQVNKKPLTSSTTVPANTAANATKTASKHEYGIVEKVMVS